MNGPRFARKEIPTAAARPASIRRPGTPVSSAIASEAFGAAAQRPNRIVVRLTLTDVNWLSRLKTVFSFACGRGANGAGLGA